MSTNNTNNRSTFSVETLSPVKVRERWRVLSTEHEKTMSTALERCCDVEVLIQHTPFGNFLAGLRLPQVPS